MPGILQLVWNCALLNIGLSSNIPKETRKFYFLKRTDCLTSEAGVPDGTPDVMQQLEQGEFYVKCSSVPARTKGKWEVGFLGVVWGEERL